MFKSDTWVGVHLAFLAGAVLTTLGLAALTTALANGRGRALAEIGLALFLLATPSGCCRRSSPPPSPSPPPTRPPAAAPCHPPTSCWRDSYGAPPNWALAVFIALTGIGLANYGAALLASRRLARWLGWTFLASGLLLTLSVIVFGDGPPEAIELPLLLGGILALRKTKP